MNTADKRDQDDLDQRGQRLGLAVAEAMLAVGGGGGDADAEQDDEAGDEVEAVSARLPSMAIELVWNAAQLLSAMRMIATPMLASAARVVEAGAVGGADRGALTGRAGFRPSRRRRRG